MPLLFPLTLTLLLPHQRVPTCPLLLSAIATPHLLFITSESKKLCFFYWMQPVCYSHNYGEWL